MRMPDEQLDYLAKCYLALEVGALLGISFEEYLTSPNHYDGHALVLLQGHGLNIQDGQCRPVYMDRRRDYIRRQTHEFQGGMYHPVFPE